MPAAAARGHTTPQNGDGISRSRVSRVHSNMVEQQSLSQYLFQVVPMLDECQSKLQRLFDRKSSALRSRSLLELRKSLCFVDNQLVRYIHQAIDSSFDGSYSDSEGEETAMQAMDTFKALLVREQHDANDVEHRNPQEPSYSADSGERCSFYQSITAKTAIDTLLFRLIVALELLLLRIDDAHFVLVGHRMATVQHHHETAHAAMNAPSHSKRFLVFGACAGAGLWALKNRDRTQSLASVRPWLPMVYRGAGGALLGWMTMKGMAKYWMTDKIIRSADDLKDWASQWELIHRRQRRNQAMYARNASNNAQNANNTESLDELLGIDDRSRQLIEHAMKHGRKQYFWRSTGEIRFLMLKRFMDVYYASVGTAINTHNTSSLALPLVTGAAASLYSITGVSQEALSEVINESSRDLIKHAWGMVSLPALKSLMLQASRLMKGAAVADRILLCGVSCIILSKDPVPELAATLQPGAKRRPSQLSKLSTIGETEVHENEEEMTFGKKSFVGRCGEYRQRDVILHLTGGGFFAHTIASDLPFLMEWSARTGAVVICPEYALLPENQFPTALDQIIDIYSALARGDTRSKLGFEVNHICVTGESVGGNLAAALCVHLAQQQSASPHMKATLPADTPQKGPERLPDGIMLSCAALNLTKDLTLSRFLGTEDPVLPNALISAICEAYLPSSEGPHNGNAVVTDAAKNPLASPFFAPDEIMRQFPPALLFASSNDPLLDDSVVFNERLRALGCSSELIAARNVPHAYLGLGTAGFPEAVQVQERAMEWLKNILHS